MTQEKIDKRFYQLQPWRVVADTTLSYLLIALAIYLAISSQSAAIWLLAIILIGAQQYALQIIHHDGMHWRLFPSKRSNDLFCRLFLSPQLFTTLPGFREKHLLHHSHLGTEKDPDRYYHQTIYKATRAQFLLFLTSIGSIVSTLQRILSGFLDNNKSSAAKPTAKSSFITLDTGLLLLAQGILFVLLTYFGGILAYPLLWVAPFAVGVFLPQNLRSFAEHAQPEPDEQADLHREITFVSNRLERFFIAPKNMNYHAEHHFYPGVPYYFLPELRAQLEKAGLMDKVEYRQSYLSFLVRYWLALPIVCTVGPQKSDNIATEKC